MIQDIAPHHFANEYRPSPPEKESFLLFYRGRDVLLTERDGKLVFRAFPSWRERIPSFTSGIPICFR